MRVIWYTAMSMDGRIADADDNLAFLQYIDLGGNERQDDFDSFMNKIDALIVGANTMRWLLKQGEPIPAAGKPTWVMTRDDNLRQAVEPTDNTPVHFFEGDVRELLDNIESSGFENVWLCGGGVVAGQILALDRIDEVIATVASTALGAGPTLFEQVDLPLRRFELVECRQIGNAARLRWTRELGTP